ncbi:ABC transporter ATP-binding protein [Rhizobium sp. P32RR-XVIII]|uniref:ABC transporter ATP-binding protein n=1 Tax=Rhizobium sp. P32RR-XVIII TaxID=2726738 RepID=UPI001456D41C|nr:ABC transporter ATP-binding protein [Rhizobium sp. P32RR-XVIII]NLS08073.1 ABC transporter ATP-binding protein [Rhizobium sp. P32RR-XVIII]
MNTPLLEVDHLSVDFQTVDGLFHAVKDISFSIEKGETLAIIGESGSGKSVTASAILGLLDMPPAIMRSGDIHFRGKSLLKMPRAERRAAAGRDISVVFQDPLVHLNPVFPVGWQIAEVCRIHGSSRTEADRLAIELLGRVGISNPEKRQRQYPHEFSGGQRQRIMIAMSMAMKPALLIADEPTTALDVTVQAQILDLLRDIQRETGTSILMITHDLGVAADVADRVLVMRRGEMVETGAIRDVLLNPRQQYTRDLIAAGEMAPGPPRSPAEKILEVSNVSLQYGDVKVVHDMSLTLHKGEIMCIVGESGSGKSTLARSILRLMSPSSGEIKFHGADITQLDKDGIRRYQRAVQAVFQDPYSSLNPRMKVMDIIAEPWTIQKDVLPRQHWRERAGALLESVGLDVKALDKFPGEFSGGQRQRIAIARALAMSSEIIVCDEAVSALDLTVQAQVITLLRDLRDRLNVALLFICHDLNLVRSFADSVLVMQGGKVVEQGAAATLFDEPKHFYTQRLIAASPVADPVAQSDRRHARQALDRVDNAAGL